MAVVETHDNCSGHQQTEPIGSNREIAIDLQNLTTSHNITQAIEAVGNRQLTPEMANRPFANYETVG